MTTYGRTWWSGRFVAALEAMAHESRLRRGRTYARRGTVHDLTIAPGLVSARVDGSRPRPYAVEIEVDVLTEAEWERVEAEIAAQAGFLALLLAGEMPPQLEDAFAAAGASLFPRNARELRTRCSCPDAANPCKHVAAVLYALAERFDADPWLILAWRGRDRAALTASLRARRAAQLAPAPPSGELPLDGGFWRARRGIRLAGGPRPGRARPDAFLVELGPPPASAGGEAAAARLRELYAALGRGEPGDSA
jgi:uncharacterized Zn finger protein